MSISSKRRAAPGVARALPWVVRARWKVRRTTDLRTLIAEHDYSDHERGRAVPVDALRRGVEGALRIVGPREHHCVPRALALFALLTRSGYPAVFVSGVRREGVDLQGHAWILVGEEPVEADAARDGLIAFREQLRVVSRTGGRPARG